MNERETGVRVKLQGAEVVKVDECKNLVQRKGKVYKRLETPLITIGTISPIPYTVMLKCFSDQQFMQE